MDNFTISSIQQIGIGTADFRKSWDWYIKMFGFDVRILEDDTVAERMLPYTGGVPQKRHACIAVNIQGGGGLEIWQYSERTPMAAGFTIQVGDLGIFAAKLKCNNIGHFHQEMKDKWPYCSKITSDPSGCPCFFLIDPFGNTFQIVERRDIFINDNKSCGGVSGAMIGVTDMNESVGFYRDILGYDSIIYDEQGSFADLDMMSEIMNSQGRVCNGTEIISDETVSGTARSYRRVLLARSEKPVGAFSGLLGTNSIELVQTLNRKPTRIYEGRYWGDPGFIQICYDVCGMSALGEHLSRCGHPFTVDSCPNGGDFDMGDASGHFTYIQDPDGTLIEFVETHRIPVLKKTGWFINLSKRNVQKPLPKTIFRIMALFSRVRAHSGA